MFTGTTGGLIQVTQTGHSSDHVTVNISLCASVPPSVTLCAIQSGGTARRHEHLRRGITNLDGPNCPATTFTLTYSGSPGGTITPSSLSLNSVGAIGSATLQVNAPAGLASGIYPIEVQVSDADNVPPAHPVSSKLAALSLSMATRRQSRPD